MLGRCCNNYTCITLAPGEKKREGREGFFIFRRGNGESEREIWTRKFHNQVVLIYKNRGGSKSTVALMAIWREKGRASETSAPGQLLFEYYNIRAGISIYSFMTIIQFLAATKKQVENCR